MAFFTVELGGVLGLKLGELLKETRKEKNVTLIEAEKATKIRTAYLEALENDEFHLIPGRIYIIGFLKSYAKYLGLNGEDIVQMYKFHYSEDKQEESEELVEHREIHFPIRDWKKKYLIVGALLLSVLIMTFVWYHQSLPSEDLASEDPSQIMEPNIQEQDDNDNDGYNQTDTEEKSNKKPLPAEKLLVEVTILDFPCWVQVSIDGKQEFTGTLQPNSQQKFSGDKEITIRYGNAGAAKVIVNGEDMGVAGKLNNVETKTYTIPKID